MVSGFEVTRRILVDLEGIGLKRKWLAGLEPEKVHMMIGRLIPQLPPCEKGLKGNGKLSAFWQSPVNADVDSVVVGSMTIDCLGILTELSDCKHNLFPVGYQ